MLLICNGKDKCGIETCEHNELHTKEDECSKKDICHGYIVRCIPYKNSLDDAFNDILDMIGSNRPEKKKVKPKKTPKHWETITGIKNIWST